MNGTGDGVVLGRLGWNSLRLADLAELSYWTYQTSASNSNLLIALQIQYDADVTDGDITFQGRLVFEPYLATGLLQPVQNATWQQWNTLDSNANGWWATGGPLLSDSCLNSGTGACAATQSSPCTLARIISCFPDIAVHPSASLGAILFKAGSGWASFDGNVDGFAIRSVSQSEADIYDFNGVDPTITPTFSLTPTPSITPTPTSTVTVTLTRTPSVTPTQAPSENSAGDFACSDQFDNDFDGDTDCNDSDCASSTRCAAPVPVTSPHSGWFLAAVLGVLGLLTLARGLKRIR